MDPVKPLWSTTALPAVLTAGECRASGVTLASLSDAIGRNPELFVETASLLQLCENRSLLTLSREKSQEECVLLHPVMFPAVLVRGSEGTLTPLPASESRKKSAF